MCFVDAGARCGAGTKFSSELALLAGEKDIAQAAESRLILYRKQRPYHQQDPEGHKSPRQ